MLTLVKSLYDPVMFFIAVRFNYNNSPAMEMEVFLVILHILSSDESQFLLQ